MPYQKFHTEGKEHTIITVQFMLMSQYEQQKLNIVSENSKLTTHSVSQIVCSSLNFPNKHLNGGFCFSISFTKTTKFGMKDKNLHDKLIQSIYIYI